MSEENRQICEFGPFRLDAARRLLLRRDDGTVVKLTAKGFDTLLVLVRRPGETLTKEELLSAVWPETIVEENNLSQKISELRRALGERQGEHRYIVTVPGRGFSFVAEVIRDDPGESGSKAKTSLPAGPSTPSRSALRS
ncbi:MAG: transcriptional regulator, partial [Acidobacteria bacterium]|nr:transcriptional regulator [Acidobacteriota bacterium]